MYPCCPSQLPAQTQHACAIHGPVACGIARPETLPDPKMYSALFTQSTAVPGGGSRCVCERQAGGELGRGFGEGKDGRRAGECADQKGVPDGYVCVCVCLCLCVLMLPERVACLKSVGLCGSVWVWVVVWVCPCVLSRAQLWRRGRRQARRRVCGPGRSLRWVCMGMRMGVWLGGWVGVRVWVWCGWVGVMGCGCVRVCALGRGFGEGEDARAGECADQEGVSDGYV